MQQTTVIEENVQDYQIDPKIGAVKLIEALLEMGKIRCGDDLPFQGRQDGQPYMGAAETGRQTLDG